jgi:hypothetical protein
MSPSRPVVDLARASRRMASVLRKPGVTMHKPVENGLSLLSRPTVLLPRDWRPDTRTSSR